MYLKFNVSFVVVAILCMFAIRDVKAATTEQMLLAGSLMRDACLPRFAKVTKEIADDIKTDGKFPSEKDAKCYVNCVLEMMNTMKKGKFLYESSIKQVDIHVPDEFKAEYKTGLLKCKDVGGGVKDNCEKAFLIFNCLRSEITVFLFP